MNDNDFIFLTKIFREEKGFHAEEVEYKKHIVNTINLLLCHVNQENLVDTAVGLKIAIERLGIDDVCHIWIDTNSEYKLRLFYEPLGTYDGNYYWAGSDNDTEKDKNETEELNGQ